ncbi:MAG: hypothetical protein O2907_08465 [Proteobacteria bacterium]|nr:hypothetical protein [Pseudomonadota bacterium]MDA1064342.1 hypothetical protein [Pseudomonadota bacterium]
MPSKEEISKGFRIGDWEVYPARGELRCGEQVEKPEPKVMAVLLSLAMRDGDVVTKDELGTRSGAAAQRPTTPSFAVFFNCAATSMIVKNPINMWARSCDVVTACKSQSNC